MKRFLPLLALSACVASTATPSPDRTAPAFAPIAFFAGRTEGVGRLRVAMSSAREVRVSGEGHVDGDGTLTLVQRVAEGDKPVRMRTWLLRRTGADAYAGTLTDAVGPVAAQVFGNMLYLRFTAKGGVAVEQWLVLKPGGRVVQNHLVAHRFGMRLAVLDETITQTD